MKIYLAARYGRRLEMLEHAGELSDLGHTVTSHWIDGHNERNSPHGARADQEADESERALWAEEDLLDLRRSDTCILFSEPPDAPGRSRGGRMVEFGIAFAMRLRLIVVGHRENVFCCLPQVQLCATWDDCLAVIEEITDALYRTEQVRVVTRRWREAVEARLAQPNDRSSLARLDTVSAELRSVLAECDRLLVTGREVRT